MRQVEQAAAHWREPDRGIWEVRGEPQHFTASKIMCWVALDRGARLARLHDEHDCADSGRRSPTRSTPTSWPTASTSAACSSQRYGTDALDASLLLVPLVRFLPPDDPRIRATVLAIADELTDDGLVLRYRVEETDDGLAGRGGHVHHLLVLAGLGAGRDRRGRTGPRAVREAAVVRRPARPVRRGARPAHRPAPRQLPAGVHPPRADQRRHARHPAAEKTPVSPSVPGVTVHAGRAKGVATDVKVRSETLDPQDGHH